MEGKGREMRMKFDTNYLVLAGAEQGSGSCQGQVWWVPCQYSQEASLKGEAGLEGGRATDRALGWESLGNPRMSDLDGS